MLFFFPQQGKGTSEPRQADGLPHNLLLQVKGTNELDRLNIILYQSSREGIIKVKMGLGVIFANSVKTHLALLVVRQELTKQLILHNFKAREYLQTTAELLN